MSNALAAEATETQAADPGRPTRPAGAVRARSHQAPAAQGRLKPRTRRRPGAGRSRCRVRTQRTGNGHGRAHPTVLSSLGGAVVADCRPGGAYLVSWSPYPGYEVGSVVRGPAVTGGSRFSSTANAVTMLAPARRGALRHQHLTGSPGTGSDDDGGWGGDD